MSLGGPRVDGVTLGGPTVDGMSLGGPTVDKVSLEGPTVDGMSLGGLTVTLGGPILDPCWYGPVYCVWGRLRVAKLELGL